MKFKIQITSSLLSGLFQSILAFLYETFQTDFADLQLRTEKNEEKKITRLGRKRIFKRKP